jgi:hypothetical protein
MNHEMGISHVTENYPNIGLFNSLPSLIQTYGQNDISANNAGL